MKFHRAVVSLFFCLVMWSAAPASEALSPLETLKGPFDRVIAILNTPAGSTPTNGAQRRTQIWEEVSPLFDFGELSRRAVGKQWRNFTKEEQAKFQQVFAKFLANTYIDKIQGDYNNEKIIFVSELVRDEIALARTKLVRETFEMPVDYRMKQVNGQWKIYDVLVENGVSLVKNYRVQFTSALQKESPAQLIQRLEKKLDGQTAD
jgi:phospholipid transport system substrate-binding protein